MPASKSRLLASLTLAALLAACGSSTPSGSVVAPSASVAPTASPVATPSPTPSPSPSVTPAASGPSAGEAISALNDLDSYRLRMEVVQAAGTTVADILTIKSPAPAQRYDIETPAAGAVAIVIIGDQAWVSNAGSAFVQIPAGQITQFTAALDPSVLASSFDSGDLSGFENLGTEAKNGIQAVHFHADETTPTPPGSTATIPPGATFDFWLAEDGYLVALEADGIGAMAAGTTSLSMQVSAVNDPANVIEPPA